jgi:hypothetical protein
MLIGLASALGSYASIPAKVPVIVGAIGATLALICQFAVTDTAIVKAAVQDPGTLLQHLPEIIDQAKEVAKTAEAISGNSQIKSIFPPVPVSAKIDYPETAVSQPIPSR